MTRWLRSAGAAALAALALGWAEAALADESAIAVELNKLEAVDGACRAFLVIENDTGSAFEALALDLVVFDAEGVIAERLAVDLAPLSPGRVLVKAFDIAGLACAEAGRFLVNGVLECRGPEGALEGCAGLVAPRGRGDLRFVG